MDRNILALILFALTVFVLVVIDRWIPGPKKLELSKPKMNTDDNATKSNQKVDVAQIAFPIAILETVLVIIITQLAVGGIATVISFLAVVPLMVGSFVGGALGKRKGGDWKGVARAAVFGSLLVLVLFFICIGSQN